MRAVIKLGGFVFSPDQPSNLVESYVKALTELATEHRIAVVAGGGSIARYYISTARKMNVPESLCDQLGILASRLNARLLIDGLGNAAFPEVPEDVYSLARYYSSGRIVAMGGLQPGHSTNAVAAIAAETIKADILVNATDVDGVYDSDPHKNAHAKKLEEVTVNQLLNLLSRLGVKAGEYPLMDPLALRIIERSGIPTVILDGRDPKNLQRALRNEKVGTKILQA